MQRLREDPQLDYDTLRVAGEAAGIPLLPIQFGRARRQLGLTGNGATASVAAAGNAPRSEPMANGREAAAGGDATADESAPEAPARDVEPAPAGPAPVPGPGLTRKSTPAFEFLVEALRAEPTISYGELKARADGKDLRIAP
ncbi:MAG: hypothetical protein KAI24_08485, partial [Planctomycetes bacterium]|nr:hypothetical protein [Planctomycetota bacterium]